MAGNTNINTTGAAVKRCSIALTGEGLAGRVFSSSDLEREKKGRTWGTHFDGDNMDDELTVTVPETGAAPPRRGPVPDAVDDDALDVVGLAPAAPAAPARVRASDAEIAAVVGSWLAVPVSQREHKTIAALARAHGFQASRAYNALRDPDAFGSAMTAVAAAVVPRLPVVLGALADEAEGGNVRAADTLLRHCRELARMAEDSGQGAASSLSAHLEQTAGLARSLVDLARSMDTAPGPGAGADAVAAEFTVTAGAGAAVRSRPGGEGATRGRRATPSADLSVDVAG